MKRSELTTEIMKDRGFKPVNSNNLRLKDIVFNIQENEYWKYLRCRIDKSEVYTTKEFGMCSTYEIRMWREYLEYSTDNVTWFPVAYRYIEFNRYCTYAD
jgi:hypothetical protein